MMIYVIFCDKKFSKDLQLRKMLQFEKIDSFHPKPPASCSI